MSHPPGAFGIFLDVLGPGPKPDPVVRAGAIGCCSGIAALLLRSVAEAAKTAGKSETTVRTWCRRHHIGRRIGGNWAVSKVALAMLLEEDLDALAAYHDGARAQYDRGRRR